MNTSRGFVALMSVVVIGAILSILVFTIGASTFFSRFDVLEAEYKRISLGLAEGCVDAAMLRLALNASYVPAAGGDCVSLGGTCGGSDPQKVCRICSVTRSGTNATTTVRALYNGAYTNLTVGLNATPGSFSVQYWNENPTYSGASCAFP